MIPSLESFKKYLGGNCFLLSRSADMILCGVTKKIRHRGTVCGVGFDLERVISATIGLAYCFPIVFPKYYQDEVSVLGIRKLFFGNDGLCVTFREGVEIVLLDRIISGLLRNCGPEGGPEPEIEWLILEDAFRLTEASH